MAGGKLNAALNKRGEGKKQNQKHLANRRQRDRDTHPQSQQSKVFGSVGTTGRERCS
jgi:hypothetical protein